MIQRSRLTITLDNAVISKLNSQRGLIPMSRFIESKISKSFIGVS